MIPAWRRFQQGGHDVRLLDANPTYVPAVYVGSRAWPIMGMLAVSGLVNEHGYTLTGFEDGAATFAKADGTSEIISADTVIFCQGRQSCDALVKSLEREPITLHTVGDVRRPRSYANASTRRRIWRARFREPVRFRRNWPSSSPLP